MMHHRFFSVENGLASRYVSDATIDSRGVMWFSTFGGISRFDGNSFLSFSKNDGLKSNITTRIVADKKGHLFVFSIETDTKNQVQFHTQAFDVYANAFIPISSVIPKLPFPEKNIYHIHFDSLDATYILRNNPFQVWKSEAGGDFQLVSRLTAWDDEIRKSPSLLNYSVVKSISSGDQLFLSVNTLKKAYYITNKRVLPFDINYNQPLQLGSNHELRYLKSGEAGYHRIDDSGHDSLIASTSINTLLIDQDANISSWNSNTLSTFFLSESNLKKNIVYKNTKVDLSVIEGLGADKDKAIIKYVQTAENQFWILTNVGVYQLDFSEKYFSNYFKSSRGTIYSGSPMRGIYATAGITNKTQDSNLVIASSWDRLLISQGKSETALPVNGMPYAVLKHKSTFYYGTYCLIQLDLRTKTSTPLDSIYNDELISIFPLNDSLLITGRRTAIFVYNINSKKTYRADNGYPQPFFISRILRTPTHGIVAVAENGLYLLNDSGKVYDFYGPQASSSSRRLPYAGIRDAYEDAQGIIWLALKEGGLIRWNWKAADPLATNQFTHFGIYEGFPSETLCRIEPDAFGCLWISTYNGLVRFNLRDYSTRIFTTKDGLTHNEFNWSSSFQAADGHLYFGGIEGVNAFNPKDFAQKETTLSVPFQLTSFTKFSEKADTTINCLPLLRSASSITMEVGDTYLNIGFALLDYSERPHRYAYRIEGINKDWHNIDQNSLLLSGLPYGQLTLHIKAQLENGQWNSSEIIIPINVLKPFYLKVWFILLCSLLLTACIILYFKLKQKRLLKNKHMLENTVQKRTVSLKKVIDQRELLIKEIHHRVRNNLQTISSLLQLQKGTLNDEKLLAVLNEGQSRVNSIALIHQSLYQNEDLMNVDFKPFIKELAKQISELFGSYNREIILHVEMEAIQLDVDTSIPLGLILNELLTNSFKYAFDENGLVDVSISLKETSPGHFEMTYSDRGPGLSEHVSFTKPNTLGLRLIKGLVHQLEGDIRYTYDDSCKFYITFISKEARSE